MYHRIGALARIVAIFVLPIFLAGCVLTPPGAKEEQAAISRAGKPYEPAIAERNVPELPPHPDWRDLLRRAFLANGDLEAAYFQWKAALARIPQVATYPNSNLAPSFNYLFSGGEMKAWDRTTISAGFDPMENLAFPTKVAAAGKIALEDARVAGKHFADAKFELQRKVLTAYLDLALHEERIRIQTDNVSLLQLLADSAAARAAAGGNQNELLRAQMQYRIAENELIAMQSEHMGMRAALNGLLARPADAPLELPAGLPPARTVTPDDSRLIAAAATASPQLAALAHEVAGRRDALELARMGYIPDINPMASLTGGASQMVGAMIVIPTTLPEIKGRIDEAIATLRASEATLRQARFDRAASFVAALYVMRNGERQAEALESTVLPRAAQAMASVRDAYSTGQATFGDLLDTQRTLLELRLTIAQIRIEREKRLAELEALAGVDIETLGTPTSSIPSPSTTVPSTYPFITGEQHHE